MDDAFLHVHGGSALLERIAAAGIGGARMEWCDPVAFGPTPAGLTDEAWYQTRARYLVALVADRDPGDVAQGLRRQDRELLEAAGAGKRLVIWAGPELFCQAILMRLLVLLDGRVDAGAIDLVDPGDQPGLPGCGLGQQPPEGLRALLDGRRPLAPGAFALAARCWAAFTAPGARRLAAVVADDGAGWEALPQLRAALQRHLADLPDGATGLSTTETRLLEVLGGRAAPVARGPLFHALAAREPRPFLTDTYLDEILRRLGGGQPAAGAPLVTLADDGAVTLADRGRDVLAGHDVWSAERWHGGVWIGRDPEGGGGDAGEGARRAPSVS
jgi:hypothetical protein